MKTSADKRIVMVIFGATGDLAHKKLLPALYQLKRRSLLPEDFHVIGIGRRDKTDDDYRQDMYLSIKTNIREKIDEDLFQSLSQNVFYHKQDFGEDDGYSRLKQRIAEHGDNLNIMYYLAVAPQYFEVIIQKLDEHDMALDDNNWRRVVIEKPFGRDLKTAEYLNQQITKVFPENSIYRIDHYLGKEMLQNLIVLRFANSVFEPIWNHQYIDNVQITASETMGVGTRGGYYESSGALKDMVQNHLLQLLTLTVMEPPKSLNEQDIRSQKLKVLKSLVDKLDSVETVRGQYSAGMIEGMPAPAYRDAEKVNDHSETETFAAVKFFLNTERWQGVPFYIRTGKALKAKMTEVVIEFKASPYETMTNGQPQKRNLLIIKIQPEEGILFEFNTKRPGTVDDIVPVTMDFCQNCQTGVNSPEAYERLLYDIMRGDATLFTRWEELKCAWVFTDKIKEQWQNEEPDFPNYEPGSWGPEAAEELLKKDNREWWFSQGNVYENH